MEKPNHRPQENKGLKWVLAFAVISLLLHGGIFAFLYFTPLFYQKQAAQLPPKQEVVFVNPEAFLPAPAKSLPLVDIAKPKVQKRPKKARFASQYDSIVKEETVARKIPKKADPKVEVSEAPKRPKAQTQQRKKQVAKKPTLSPSPAKKEDTSKLGQEGGGARQVSLSDLELKTSDMKDLLGDEGKAKKPVPLKKIAWVRAPKLPRCPAADLQALETNLSTILCRGLSWEIKPTSTPRPCPMCNTSHA